METLAEKTWKNEDLSPRRKLFARLLTHAISRLLDHKKYDVLYEIPVISDLKIEQCPDVVICKTGERLVPVSAIELLSNEDLSELFNIAKKILTSSTLDEFFIYNYDMDEWYYIRRNMTQFEKGSASLINELDLSVCVDSIFNHSYY